MLTLAEKRGVAKLSSDTESWLNLRRRQTLGGNQRESEIYKMCILQIVFFFQVSVIRLYVPNLRVEKTWVTFRFTLFGSFINCIPN